MMRFNPEDWDEHEREVWKSCFYRCGLCRGYGHVIHEIVPKSLTRNWKSFTNQIVLCQECHSKVHAQGAGKWREKLQNIRLQGLINYAETC